MEIRRTADTCIQGSVWLSGGQPAAARTVAWSRRNSGCPGGLSINGRFVLCLCDWRGSSCCTSSSRWRGAGSTRSRLSGCSLSVSCRFICSRRLRIHDWAVDIRGRDLVAAANFRAFWALLWFLFVYQLGAGRMFERAACPRPPRGWSPAVVSAISPPLILWGLFCAGMVLRSGADTQETVSAEGTLLLSFPFVMMVAGVLLIVTGRLAHESAPAILDGGANGIGRLRLDLDVQRQAVAFVDRRAGHGVRVLCCAAQAALMACPHGYRIHGLDGSGDRHRLARKSRLRAVVHGLHQLPRRLQGHKDPRKLERQ